MLTYEDCVGLSDLEADEIEAIAQHEHMPEIVAAEMGCCLVHDTKGIPRIRQIILDDIEDAYRHGHPGEAKHWREVLDHFSANHPLFEAREAA